MHEFRVGKGRKKPIRAFTPRKGLWIIILTAAAMATMLLLFLSGILRMDMD